MVAVTSLLCKGSHHGALLNSRVNKQEQEQELQCRAVARNPSTQRGLALCCPMLVVTRSIVLQLNLAALRCGVLCSSCALPRSLTDAETGVPLTDVYVAGTWSGRRRLSGWPHDVTRQHTRRDLTRDEFAVNVAGSWLRLSTDFGCERWACSVTNHTATFEPGLVIIGACDLLSATPGW